MDKNLILIIAPAIGLLCIGFWWYTKKKKRLQVLGIVLGVLGLFIFMTSFMVIDRIYDFLWILGLLIFLLVVIEYIVEIYRKAAGKKRLKRKQNSQ